MVAKDLATAPTPNPVADRVTAAGASNVKMHNDTIEITIDAGCTLTVDSRRKRYSPAHG